MPVRYWARRLPAASALNDNGAQICEPIGKSKPGGAMPTTSVLRRVHFDGPADDRRVGREPPLPQTVTDDHPPVPALRLLVEKEGSTHHRLHAQRREEVRRDEEALHVLGFVLADQVRIPPVEGGEPLEGIRLLPLHVEVVGWRQGFAPIDVVRLGEGEERDAIDVRHRERPEHQRIDHREHRRVGAEPAVPG